VVVITKGKALGMHWVDLDDRLQIIEEGMDRWNGPLFMEIFLLASWNIWKERNKLFFEGTAPTLRSWKERLKSDLSLLVHRTKDRRSPPPLCPPPPPPCTFFCNPGSMLIERQ
jgi:hypothetical protein